MYGYLVYGHKITTYFKKSICKSGIYMYKNKSTFESKYSKVVYPVLDDPENYSNWEVTTRPIEFHYSINQLQPALIPKVSKVKADQRVRG